MGVNVFSISIFDLLLPSLSHFFSLKTKTTTQRPSASSTPPRASKRRPIPPPESPRDAKNAQKPKRKISRAALRAGCEWRRERNEKEREREKRSFDLPLSLSPRPEEKN